MIALMAIMMSLALWVFIKYPSNEDVRKRKDCRNAHPSHGTE